MTVRVGEGLGAAVAVENGVRVGGVVSTNGVVGVVHATRKEINKLIRILFVMRQ